MVAEDEALLQLLVELSSRNYRFTCVTPATHERVLARPLVRPPSLEDIFGWNRSFGRDELAPVLLALLDKAGALEDAENGLKSLVRVASIGDHLFLHSAFPTSAQNSVFFGPDTYRFVRAISTLPIEGVKPRWIVDMGSGSGAGGIVAAATFRPERLTLVDINPAAARLALVNATHAGLEPEIIVSDQIPPGCDMVLANPPYMMDSSRRAYRDGGKMLGGEIAASWTREALQALVSGGTLLLYTGAAFVRGQSLLLEELASICAANGATADIEELDPDVFGEELDKPEYREVERIAAVAARIRKA
jgi:methylase of polypeptide subunit release factors